MNNGVRVVTPTLDSDPNAVLDFWFGPIGQRGPARIEWFRKNPRFDAEVRARFDATHRAAAAGELEAWRASAEAMVALVIVLDQFSRNLYRDDARAFAQDAHARECAREALARGDDLQLLPVQRQFLYMPFEHSEALADQDLCFERMKSLDAFPETRGLTEWSEKHRAVIRRFGRFPHRNAALGRESTPAEREFLAQPGSGF